MTPYRNPVGRINCPNAYLEGQLDLVKRLVGHVSSDDHPLAPLHDRVALTYAMWCLAFNLRVAAALQFAEYCADADCSGHDTELDRALASWDISQGLAPLR